MKNRYLTFFMIIMTMQSLHSTKLNHDFLKIGHRGACGYEPENTLLSFNTALQLGVHAVELDVHRCASGELVVIHDSTLDRTTNGTGYVHQKTLTELKKLDAGKGETIPTLAEVFDFIDRRVVINVELKGPGTASAVATLINSYVHNKHWHWNDFFVSSFDHHELQSFSRLCPNVAIGALLEGMPLGYAQFAVPLHANAIVISADCITQEYVDDAHARSMKVYVYTVNTPTEINRIKKLNIDGIISNFPDRL